MSHNGQHYRIFPDDETEHTDDEWQKAAEWVNGWEVRGDIKEAFAFAKLGAMSCNFPFVVMKIPHGGNIPPECECWEVLA